MDVNRSRNKLGKPRFQQKNWLGPNFSGAGAEGFIKPPGHIRTSWGGGYETALNMNRSKDRDKK